MPNSDAQTVIETPADVADRYALEIINVSKHFDDVAAVNQVSLSIDKGEIFALLGGSGCGKTTLLRMLAGFETPSAGDIKINGVSVLHSPPYQRPVNMMFQSYALFPHMTVEQNVAFGLKQDRMPKAEIEVRVTEVLELVQMTRFRRRKPGQLSGGQNSGWRWRAVWQKNQRCCCSTNPWGPSTKNCACRCSWNWPISLRVSASPV